MSRVWGETREIVMKNQFITGDHVENKPVATVDGIVYKVEGDTVWFCDDFGISYRMNAGSLRPRYEDFTWQEAREIMRVNGPKFRRWGEVEQ